MTSRIRIKIGVLSALPTGEGRFPTFHVWSTSRSCLSTTCGLHGPRPVSLGTLSLWSVCRRHNHRRADHLLKSPRRSSTQLSVHSRTLLYRAERAQDGSSNMPCCCPVWLELHPVAHATCGDPLRHVVQSDARRRTPPSTPIHVSESPMKRVPGLRVCERTIFHRAWSLSALLRAIVGDGARPLATAMWEPKNPLKNSAGVCILNCRCHRRIRRPLIGLR